MHPVSWGLQPLQSRSHNKYLHTYTMNMNVVSILISIHKYLGTFKFHCLFLFGYTFPFYAH